jgi:hypothetical protein
MNFAIQQMQEQGALSNRAKINQRKIAGLFWNPDLERLT